MQALVPKDGLDLGQRLRPELREREQLLGRVARYLPERVEPVAKERVANSRREQVEPLVPHPFTLAAISASRSAEVMSSTSGGFTSLCCAFHARRSLLRPLVPPP